MKTSKCGGGLIYRIPQKDIEYIGYFPASAKKETVKSAYQRIGKERGRATDIICNAELFDFTTRKPASDVVHNGEVHRLTEGYGIAFPKNNSAVFSYKNNVGAKDYVGAYPVLVQTGAVKIGSTAPVGLGGARGRTAIGTNAEELYIALIPDGAGVQLRTLASALKSAGAVNAINLDGGGSTQYYAPNANYFSSRPVRGFIAVWIRGEYRTVRVRTSLNIRAGAGITYKKIGSYKNGARVKIIEEKLGWARTPDGWVSSIYLKK